MVVRKGNVIIKISASGSDIPGRSVAEGKPLGERAVRRTIEAVSDRLIHAVKPKIT